MNMALKRLQWRPDGVFGELHSERGELIAQTLEHAYLGPPGGIVSKIPVGTYLCKRSMHRLHGMTEDFETFQVMDVPGCENILFHWGNWNKDSEGCILLGLHVTRAEDQSQMITHSRETWAVFMKRQEGVAEFELTVD